MNRWRALAPEQGQVALAAAALAATLLLPWYQTSTPAVVGGRAATVEGSLNAFEAFSFVEAAILLVAAAVLYLLWARAEQRAFHLPGGDGWAITAGGAWALFLLVWRLFDKPDVQGAAVGVQWGIFLAMGAAGALLAAGQRVRAAHRPEPPNPVAEENGQRPRPPLPPRRRAPRRPDALDTAPKWEGEAPTLRLEDEPEDAPTERLPPPPPPAQSPPPDRLF